MTVSNFHFYGDIHLSTRIAAMRLLRTRFRRRKNVGAGNQHIFARRNLRNQMARGLVVRPAVTNPAANLPGETNRQFAERMRAEASA